MYCSPHLARVLAEVRRALIGPGPRRQARRVGRGRRRSRVGPKIISANRLETIFGALDAGGSARTMRGVPSR